MKESNTRQYSVPAVEKTIAILDALAEGSQRQSATELHTRLGLPKATVFMILNVLERHGLVTKGDDSRYALGSRIYRWGINYAAHADVVTVAHADLVALSEQTGFTSHLGILYEQSMMFVDKVEPDTFIRFSTMPGMRQDIHVSSLGKAIAAYLGDDALASILGRGQLPAYTPHTITTANAFETELRRIRENGYAIEDEEGELGVRCVGAPVFNRQGHVVAAMSITGLASQIAPSDFPRLGSQVRAAADAVSDKLGHRAVAPRSNGASDTVASRNARKVAGKAGR